MKGLVAADWGCAVFNDRRRVPHARENKRRAAELIGCVNGAAERVDQEATMLGVGGIVSYHCSLQQLKHLAGVRRRRAESSVRENLVDCD